MNPLRIWKQLGCQWSLWLVTVVALALTVGCKDAAPESDLPAVDTLAGKTHVPPETEPLPLSGQPVTPPGPTVQPDVPPRLPLLDRAPPKKSIAIPAVKPDEIYEPRVVLSRAHEQTCLVNVGDVLPSLALHRVSGDPVALDELRGDKLTVVVFWSNREVFGREEFRRLAAEVALPFQHLGVKVVAVNVGDPAEQIEVDELTEEALTCVLDSDGSALAQIATGKLPRTYLVDGKGRVLWFDIEYSRTMRRQLRNAIFYFSRDASSAAS